MNEIILGYFSLEKQTTMPTKQQQQQQQHSHSHSSSPVRVCYILRIRYEGLPYNRMIRNTNRNSSTENGGTSSGNISGRRTNTGRAVPPNLLVPSTTTTTMGKQLQLPPSNRTTRSMVTTATPLQDTVTLTSSVNTNSNPVVVASLQSSSSTSTFSSTTASSPSTTTTSPSTGNSNSSAMITNHPAYNSIALSPCREYGIIACKDTIQLIQITPNDGIVLLKVYHMAPHFRQQQQQQYQHQHQHQQKLLYAPSETTINRFNNNNNSTLTSTSSSSYSTPTSTTNTFNLRDFALGGVGTQRTSTTTASSNNSNNTLQGGAMDVVITNVAWSNGNNDVNHLQPKHTDSIRTDPSINSSEHNTIDSDSSSHPTSRDHLLEHENEHEKKLRQEHCLRTSFIAAAGSNGVIVVWSAETLLQPLGIIRPISTTTTATISTTNLKSPSSSSSIPTPLAILNQHVRQVNTLGWHPIREGVLLSGSQDWTVVLWERRKYEQLSDTNSIRSNNTSVSTNYQSEQQQQQYGLKGFFSGFGNNANNNKYQQQQQRQQNAITQQQEQEKKSIYQWHCRTIYSPKSEAIREVKWSPFYHDVFALVTNSGSLIVYHQDISARTIIRTTAHSGDASTVDWHPTRRNMIATGGDRSVKIWDFEREFERELLSQHHHLNFNKDDILSNMERNANTGTSRGESIGTTDSSTAAGTDSPYTTIGASNTYGARTISSVSSGGNLSQRRKMNILHVLSISASVTRIRWRPVASLNMPDGEDRHDAMIGVATAPIKGANAGGAGTLSLWSFHRPYMPLSVVEGHKDGTVVDFDWLDTPQHSYSSSACSTQQDSSSFARIWQHVISVGKDGHCLIQSLVRGDRPLSRVPPSCFAMANLSPFQKGYGSLQLFTVYQPVPSGPESDIRLTGLRRDIVTANAPGIFREIPVDKSDGDVGPIVKWRVDTRVPEESPKILFNVIDQGDLDDDSNPIDDAFDLKQKRIIVAPEVVHLSRFADRYKLYPDSDCPTRTSVCQHNAEVADSMSQSELANMWRILTLILENCVLSGTSNKKCSDGTDTAYSNEMMQHVFLPSVKELLEERADAGDVQTCVVICEILEVIRPDQTVLIPSLQIEIVREWYLSYIDLLRDMCLFSHATFVIKNCRDPFIGTLNQQSTTIYESCQICGKELLNEVDTTISSNKVNNDGEYDEGTTTLLFSSNSVTRRKCKRCRNRVGFCFICHEPVKGVYVWCPGCGHGGHLDHALQWFGSSGTANNIDGTKGTLRNMCPTGCGHLCNSLREVSAFPRTESFL